GVRDGVLGGDTGHDHGTRAVGRQVTSQQQPGRVPVAVQPECTIGVPDADTVAHASRSPIWTRRRPALSNTLMTLSRTSMRPLPLAPFSSSPPSLSKTQRGRPLPPVAEDFRSPLMLA